MILEIYEPGGSEPEGYAVVGDNWSWWYRSKDDAIKREQQLRHSQSVQAAWDKRRGIK